MSGAPESRRTSLAGRSTVYAPNGAIATSQPLATAEGLAVLQRGGNAFDAAVTAAAVLNVVEPMMTGAGGDLFALCWLESEQRLIGLNASGRSGSQLTRDELRRRGHETMPTSGAESVTVPGALAGWRDLLAAHGTQTLGAALEPAIRLAADGFPLTPVIARDWANQTKVLEADEGGRATYLPGGRAPRTGEWVRNVELAATLQRVANRGIEIFYGGELGARVAARVQQLGGFITVDDLAAHRSEWVTPLSVSFKGHRLYELPPNGQGIAALEMLRILEPFDLAGMGLNSAEYLHHLIEAKKLAFADLEQFVGDPAAMPTPAERLLADDFIDARRTRLSPRATERQEPGPALTQSDTVYLTAADRFGNMVSLINSVAGLFGSGVVVPGTGLLLQNRGAGFTLREGLPNTAAPRKRPFHTIIPAFVTRTAPDGREQPWLSYGVMGGPMQPQGHVQVLLNLLVFAMDLQAALDAPRFRHIKGNEVGLEPPIEAHVRDALRARGHIVSELPPGNAGGGQAIARLARGYAAASDPRKDGMAAGH